MTSRRTATCLAGVILLAQLALVAAVDVAPATAARGTSTPGWLARVNQIRTGSGLPAVTADSSWTKGIKAHLTYLAKTPAKYETGNFASAHTENPASPYYTKAGALEAGRSDLAFDTSSDLGAINEWLEAPFHAIGMLRAGLTKVAFVRDPTTGDAGLDVIGGDVQSNTHSEPILYPGSGATIDLASYGGESPSPIETCTTDKPSGADYSNPGLPIIVMLSQAPTNDIAATLQQPDGPTISSSSNDLCIVDENNFTSSDPIYGSTGREILADDHAVLIIPRTRLVAGSYTVDVTQSAQPDINWSFTSQPAASPPEIAVTVQHCSDSLGHNGSATLFIENPSDGQGAANYTVTLDGKTKHASAGDGDGTEVEFPSVAAGSHTAKIVGSDGSSATALVHIATCPSYSAARAKVGKVHASKGYASVRLDNTRNKHKTTFKVETTAGPSHNYGVPGGKSQSIHVSVARHGNTKITVKIGHHTVTTATVH